MGIHFIKPEDVIIIEYLFGLLKIYVLSMPTLLLLSQQDIILIYVAVKHSLDPFDTDIESDEAISQVFTYIHDLVVMNLPALDTVLAVPLISSDLHTFHLQLLR